MKLTNLISLYKDIKDKNLTYAIFDYKYNKLREILEIPNGKGSKFCTNDFFEHFNLKIPNLVIERNISHETRKLLSNACNCEDSNKIYLLGFTNWEDKIKGHYSKSNREKVRLLYPQIYETIKNKNISIRFTDNQKYSKNSKLSDLKEINDENDFKGTK